MYSSRRTDFQSFFGKMGLTPLCSMLSMALPRLSLKFSTSLIILRCFGESMDCLTNASAVQLKRFLSCLARFVGFARDTPSSDESRQSLFVELARVSSSLKLSLRSRTPAFSPLGSLSAGVRMTPGCDCWPGSPSSGGPLWVALRAGPARSSLMLGSWTDLGSL